MSGTSAELDAFANKCLALVRDKGTALPDKMIGRNTYCAVAEYRESDIRIETKTAPGLWVCMMQIWVGEELVFQASGSYLGGEALDVEASTFLRGDWEKRLEVER